MKAGIDFFPLDVHLDDKWKLIEAEFGLKGFAVVVKLHQKIYGERGYYGEWDEDVALLFSRTCGPEGGSAVSEIINSAIKRGIFDRNMYEKYSILTSTGIQKRYFDAVKRRKEITVTSEYLLFDVTHLLKDVNIIWKNVSTNCENVYISQQSKVEKSKVEKSIKVSKSQQDKTEGATSRGTHIVFKKPTIEEIMEYCAERKNNVDPQRFYDFYESKGWVVGRSPMKDWKAAVRTWERNGYGGKASNSCGTAKRDYDATKYSQYDKED